MKQRGGSEDGISVDVIPREKRDCPLLLGEELDKQHASVLN